MPFIFMLRCLITVLPLWFALTGFAQTEPKVFTSPDRVFRFQYFAFPVDCTKLTSRQPESSDTPEILVGHPAPISIPESCEGQRVCTDGGDQGSILACFGYPKDRFGDKPTFGAAAFFVADIDGAATEKLCLQSSPYWFQTKDATTSQVNGIGFTVFEIADNWAGGGQSGPVYRTFHDNKYYELGIQSVKVRGGYDEETIKSLRMRTAREWRAD